MLHNLHVKNLALIDETEVEFGPGLNILTGETGAGKSILLGSVSLALGGRYSADMLRSGSSAGLVELTFSVDDSRIREKLAAMDILPEDGFVTLSRKLTEGRSISRINGETVNMNTLKKAAGLIIDIHGQHDSQSLLDKKNHLSFLDLFSGDEIIPLKEEMAEAFRTLQETCRMERDASLDEESRRNELSLAEFEVNEIENASLICGEDTEVEERYRRMTDSKKVTDALAEARRYTCQDAGGNASDCLSRAIRALQDVADFDEAGGRLYDQLVETDSLLNDFNRELSEYAGQFEFSDEEFRETEDRLNLLNHMKAKYGRTIEDIQEYYERKKQRITELYDYDAYMNEISGKKKKALERTEKAADALHCVREKNAVLFSEKIREQMKELNFMDSRLEIRLTDSGSFSASGRDEAEFYLSVNPGEPLKPMGSIASGGELSRVMLAVKTVLADKEDTPTLIFDEIDAGISGVTAGKVGEKLRLISQSRQVICITHLAQIAAAADVHFLIEKSAEDQSVHTRINRLDEEGSVKELARIVGGSAITGHILESARELKKLSSKER